MKKKYILTILHNQTLSEAFLLDKKAQIVGHGQQEIEPIKRSSTHIEYDPLDIIYSIRSAIHKSLKSNQIDAEEIASIGISTDAHTTVIWDKQTGLPYHNCTAKNLEGTTPICQQLSRDRIDDSIRERTGLSLTQDAPATLLKWLMDTNPDLQHHLKKKTLMLGTLDTWILYNLTGRTTHKTDRTHASKTLLMNLKETQWDPFLLKEFHLNHAILPEIMPSQADFGTTQHFVPLPDGIPIVTLCEKDSARLIGTSGFNFGQAKLSFENTGEFLINTGTDCPEITPHANPTLIANGATPHYGLHAKIPFPNMDIPWFPQLTKLTNPLSEAPPNSVHILPTDTHKMTLSGLHAGTTAEELTHAYFEAIVFQTNTTLRQLESEHRLYLKELKADGPLSSNNHLLQFQADILQLPVIRMAEPQTQALGTALLTGLNSGFFKDKQDIQKHLKIDRTFLPSMDPISSLSRYNQWKRFQTL